MVDNKKCIHEVFRLSQIWAQLILIRISKLSDTRGLLYNKDIDKVLLHFKHIINVFINLDGIVSVFFSKYGMQYSNC